MITELNKTSIWAVLLVTSSRNANAKIQPAKGLSHALPAEAFQRQYKASVPGQQHALFARIPLEALFSIQLDLSPNGDKPPRIVDCWVPG